MSLRRIALLGVLSLACLAVAACVDIDPAYEAFSRLLEQRAAGLQSKAPASNQRTGGSAPVGSSLIPDPAAPPAANSTAAPKGGSNVRTAATADVHPCGNGVCDAGETCSTCPQDCTQGDGSPCNRVGIFYSGWHWPAWAATEIGRRLGRRAYSVEDVLRSQTGTIGSKLIGTSFEKIYNAAQLETSLGFYWHHRPLQNFYCIYHARQPSELLYNAAHEGTWGAGSGPDCANWQARVQDHAQQLVATGIDYVTMDATNLDQHDAFSDAIQLRPFQVLLEEFSRLRLAGIQTPDLAMWQRLPTLPLRLTNINVTNYGFAYVMVLYNVPEYQSLILRDPVTKKKIFFYPSVADVDLNIIKYIEANGGLNDIVVQPMWVGQQKSGGWNFFAFCKNIVLESNTACAQPATPESSKVTGSQLAVSPSYQATFASVQFQAIGQNSGITLKKQWATAFTVKPDWVFLTGWNEHVAQPQDSQGLGNSMGFEYDPGFVGKAFVDIHGAAFGRDIEPTVEGGSEMMDITASCIRVFRRAVALSSTWCPPTELCCKGAKFSATYQYYGIGALQFGLFANSVNQQKAAKQVQQTVTIRRMGDPPTSTYIDRRVGLFECTSTALPSRPAFLSNSWYCENIYSRKVMKAKRVGYMSVYKGMNQLRTLIRCRSTGRGGILRDKYMINGGSCPDGYVPDKVLGYVR